MSDKLRPFKPCDDCARGDHGRCGDDPEVCCCVHEISQPRVLSDEIEKAVEVVLPCVGHPDDPASCACPRPTGDHWPECPAYRRPAVLELVREFARRAESAEAKADQYEQDWVTAKYEFGTSMKKACDERDAALALAERRGEALRLIVAEAEERLKGHGQMSAAMTKRIASEALAPEPMAKEET